MDKNSFFESLDFCGRKHTGYRKTTKDVAIVVRDYNKKGWRLTTYFRKGLSALLGDDYLKVAVYKNRIIFLGCSQKAGGVKISLENLPEKSDMTKAQFSLSDNEAKKFLPFVDGTGHAEFDLEYDTLYEYYYIERKVS